MNRSPSRPAILLALLMLVAAGCSAAGPAGAIAVMGPWIGTKPGTEGYAFRQVLRAFTERTGVAVDYQETRALTQVLQSNIQAGTPPDIAFVASAGDLGRYARSSQLYSLDDVLGESARTAFPPSWLLPQKVHGAEHVYAVPVKVNLKSMIWHGPSAPELRNVSTWNQLLAYGESLARSGTVPWCMGMGDGPGSGWPATDFIEDLMLSRFGAETYERWAAGAVAWTSAEVTTAWSDWGKIATRDDLVRGGRTGAIFTDFGDAGRSMFQQPPGCAMEHQASFIMGFYRDFQENAETSPTAGFDFVPFPSFTTPGPVTPPVIASADFAGMFKDTPQARQLMSFLATDEAQKIWPAIPGSGAFVVNEHVRPELYGDDNISRRIADTIREAPGICFDAADFMPATMRNAFNRAVLDYLADPARLPSILRQLDHVRVHIPVDDWLDRLSCRR